MSASIDLGDIQTSVTLDLTGLQASVQSVQNTFNDMSKNITNTVNNVTVNVRTMAGSVQTEAEKIAEAQRKMAREAAIASTLMQQAYARAWQGVEHLGQLATNAGSLIANALGQATHSAAEFDSALHEVSANAGLTASGFKQVHDGILAIAKDKNVHDTPAQLAKGLYEVYSAGYKGEEALQILHESAIGAAAGITDTKTASSALLTVLQSGIKGVDGTRQAMDLLLKATEAGRIHFPELANNIAKVIVPAKSFGISIQDVLASLVSFTRQGQPVARATTDLINLMGKLAHPSQAAAGEFKKLGIEYGVNALHVKGLSGVMDDLIKRTKGHTDTLLKLFPELRAYRAAVESAQNSGRSFHEILQALSHATDGQGQTMRAATEVNKGAGQQYEKMRQEIATLQTEIGEKLLPIMRQAIGHVRDLVKWFSSLSDGTKSNILRFAEWSAGILIVGGTVTRFVGLLMGIRNAYLAIAGAAQIAAAAQTGSAAAGVAGATSLLARVGAGATAMVGLAARVLNPVALTVGAMLLPQRAGTNSANDGRPHGNTQQELDLARRGVTLNQAAAARDNTAEGRASSQAIADRYKAMIPVLEARLKQEKDAAVVTQTLTNAKAATAKAEMDYAKQALAADAFPGAKDKKGKKAKQEKDPDLGDMIADHIKTATKSAPVSASCAFFVSEVLKQSGVAVKGSNSVKELWQQLIGAGAEEVKSGFKRGDILKFHGKNFGTSKDAEGKGNHTGIYNGDGTFTDSHEYNRRRSTRNLGDYMRGNPDADVKALRLGDKDDRTAQQVDKQNTRLQEAADKAKDAAEKTKEANDKIFELQHTQVEIGIRDAARERDAQIKAGADKATAYKAYDQTVQRIQSEHAQHVNQQQNEQAVNEQKLNEKLQRQFTDAGEAAAATADKLDNEKQQKAENDARAEYEWQEQKFKITEAAQVEAEKETTRIQNALMSERLEHIKEMNQTQLGQTLTMLTQMQQGYRVYSDEWFRLEKEKQRVQGESNQRILAPIEAAHQRMKAVLGQMRQNVEGILGGAFQKLFEGDSKHFFSSMLQDFTRMIEQMAAKALALGIINMLTGGAGGFLGGGGKGNGGFLSVFGFDDASNDAHMKNWGFDAGNLFMQGIGDAKTQKRAVQAGQGGNNGGGAMHFNNTFHGMVVREEADIDRIADKLAWKMQAGFTGRHVSAQR